MNCWSQFNAFMSQPVSGHDALLLLIIVLQCWALVYVARRS
jgi:hypothetical protein